MTKPTWEDLENKLGQAYPAIGWLLNAEGLFEITEGQDADVFLNWHLR